MIAQSLCAIIILFTTNFQNLYKYASVGLSLFTLLFIAASLSLGLLFSTLAKSQLQAMQMTIFVLMPSILLSGFMFPYEGMPAGAQAVADLLPATHFMRTIRGVVLRDAGLPEVLPEALWMLGFALLGLGRALDLRPDFSRDGQAILCVDRVVIGSGKNQGVTRIRTRGIYPTLPLCSTLFASMLHISLKIVHETGFLAH